MQGNAVKMIVEKINCVRHGVWRLCAIVTRVSLFTRHNDKTDVCTFIVDEIYCGHNSVANDRDFEYYF